MLPIELICEISCKLVLPSHKISNYEDVLTPHFHRLPHTCNGKTLFFRNWMNLLQQQGIVSVQSYAHHNATHKRRGYSLIWQWYAMPTSDTTGCFQEYISPCSIVMSVHMTHQYSECCAVKYPRLVTKQRHEMCFYAFIDCHLQWTTAVAM